MKVFGLKSCDTVRRALRELKAAGYAPELVDVRAEPLQPAELERFLAEFGDRLVNRASTTWRGLDEESRKSAPVALLSAHPALMKRPVIEAEGRLTLGWDAKTRALWLENPAPGA